jgi:tripartite ATP-independent transporter DctP family solute receptor
MKKFLVFILILLCAQTLFSGGSKETVAPAEAQKHQLKWSGMMNQTHAWTIAEAEMCKEVSDRTNGRITIVHYPSGSLGTQQQGIESQRVGDLAFLTSGPSIFASYVPQTQVFTFPYMLNDRAHARRVIASTVIQKLFNEEVLNKTGIRTISWWYYGVRNLTTKNTAAKTPDDISKLKIRAVDNPAAKNVILALGGNPVPVAFNELYFALQTGVADGQENPITTIYDMKFNEVQKYLILTEHNVHMGTVHVSEKIWKSFSEQDQKMFMELFAKYEKRVDDLIDKQTQDNLKEMQAKGLTVMNPDREAFRKNAVAHINKVYGTDPKWADVLNQVLAVK